MLNHVHYTKVKYRLAVSREDKYNRQTSPDMTSPMLFVKVDDTSKDITMATSRQGMRLDGDSTSGRSSRITDIKRTPKTPEISFDYQMEYKGFKPLEERNRIAYFRIAQNRFYRFNMDRNKGNPAMSVINIAKPVALRSRYFNRSTMNSQVVK